MSEVVWRAEVRAGLFNIKRCEAVGQVTSFNGDLYTIEIRLTDNMLIEVEVTPDAVEILDPSDTTRYGLEHGDYVRVIFRG